MIKLEHIQKIYHSNGIATEALKDVSLEIKEGEMVAVVGTSGSGKTTLLNMIGAMDTVTAGAYYFNGENIASLGKGGLHKFRKENISFVFQNFELLNRYSVYENVEMPLLARGQRGYRKKILDTLEQVGIRELARKKVTKLSGGQQQRCAIARAIVADTNVILADEPTGALDGKTSGEITDLLRRINESGKTVIIVTHDMEIAGQCDRIIKIEDGKNES